MFAENPKLSHEKVINRSIKYLIGTKCTGIHWEIDKTKGLTTHDDVAFSSTWNKLDPNHGKNYNMFSSTSCVTCFYDIPETWGSKLQNRTTLSSTKIECNALQNFLRDSSPEMNLINEIYSHIEISTEKKSNVVNFIWR